MIKTLKEDGSKMVVLFLFYGNKNELFVTLNVIKRTAKISQPIGKQSFI